MEKKRLNNKSILWKEGVNGEILLTTKEGTGIERGDE